jgi:predicted PolB exonuclease-like 3'-5' exonuclease
MLDKINLQKILFLDIETVPETEKFEELSDLKQELFSKKTEYQRKTDEISPKDFYQRAGIWAEFGKIICISVGFFTQEGKKQKFRLTSFYGDEKKLLEDFKKLINKHFNKPEHLLCAHNGKEFDFPFIARRMIINRIDLPDKLDLFGKKPWEVAHLDTLDLWKFGDYKHYTSLQLLTNILDIPSPKDDIDGSQVAEVYYKEKDLQRIVKYCEKDTIAVAQLLLRYKNLPILLDEDIYIITKE